MVEAGSKSQVQVPEEFLKAMGLDAEFFRRPGVGAASESALLTVAFFTPLEEIEKAICCRIAALGLKIVADMAAEKALERQRGRV